MACNSRGEIIKKRPAIREIRKTRLGKQTQGAETRRSPSGRGGQSSASIKVEKQGWEIFWNPNVRGTIVGDKEETETPAKGII